MPSSRRLLALVALLGLGLSACTNASPRSEVMSTGIGDVQASWSSIDTAETLPTEPVVMIAASVPMTGALPALAVGSVGEPGQPTKATVWDAERLDPLQAVALEVGGTESEASAVAMVGDITYVLGRTWQSGTIQPFIQSSTDRKTWRTVELPPVVEEQEVRLSEIGGHPESGLIALGLDRQGKPVSVSIESGKAVGLPTPDYGRLSGFSAATSSDSGLVAFAEVQQDEGGQQTIVLRSKDFGTTWEAVGELYGTETSVSGVVALKNGFIATGYALRGNDYGASAWFSKDGKKWFPETLPALKDHKAGWSTWLTAPTSMQGQTFVGSADSEKLANQVLRRSAQGRWSVFGEAPAWRTPGAAASVIANGKTLITVRAWNGLLQTGALTRQGTWRAGNESGAEPVMSRWETVSVLGETATFVGSRSKVEVTSDGWSMKPDLSPFAVDGGSLAATEWQPKDAEQSTSYASATDQDGNTFVAGVESRAATGQSEADATDVRGWFRAAGSSDWQEATGLSGQQTESMHTVDFHDGEWVIVGMDRSSFSGSAHSYGAVWTSSDGRSWKRAKGPFEVSSTTNSSLSASCKLDGGLLAIGSAEDNSTGSTASAFRRVNGTWERLDTTSMGADVTDLDSCASAGDTVLVQGTAGGRDAVWSTTDGNKFEQA